MDNTTIRWCAKVFFSDSTCTAFEGDPGRTFEGAVAAGQRSVAYFAAEQGRVAHITLEPFCGVCGGTGKVYPKRKTFAGKVCPTCKGREIPGAFSPVAL